MKKMISLAAMFAALSYASPASAELNISGDASTRVRGEFNNTETAAGVKTTLNDDIKYQYRVRLKAAADLGDGYFFKALLANEDYVGATTTSGSSSPGWGTVAGGNSEKFALQVSNFYFGHVCQDSHYTIGRLPLNSFNNPIFDLTLYPIPGTILAGSTLAPAGAKVYAVDVPVTQWNFDRIYGANYGTKIGNGELNATLIVFDNHSFTENTAALSDGLLNDGYAVHVSYKTNIGDVTIDPQAILTVTDGGGAVYARVTPNTFGTNVSIPAGKSKIGLSGFYTVCKDSNGISSTTGAAANVDYSGYLLRLKGESGPAMAWVDYNHTTDKTAATEVKYNNLFFWGQYTIKLHESSNGTFSVVPTIRYRASGQDDATGTTRNNQLRTELYATVTF